MDQPKPKLEIDYAVDPHQQLHECPAKKWPGYIVTDKGIGVVDFFKWFQSLPPEEVLAEETRPRACVSYELRRHFIRHAHFPDIDPWQFEGDGRELPMQVLVWINSVTSQLLAEAQDPNA